MTTHALFDNPDQLRKNVLRIKAPYYVVCDTKGEKIWWNDEESDINNAAELLYQDLSLIRQGNTATYVIKHFKKLPAGGFKKTSEPDCISTFKKEFRTEPERMEYRQNMYNSNNELLQEIRSMREDFRQLQLASSIEDNIEDDDKLEQESESKSLIGAILGNPNIQVILSNLLTNITANLITPQTKVMAQPHALAGTDAKEIPLENILQDLFSKGVTIEDLHKLSQMPAEKIASLLSMLRMF